MYFFEMLKPYGIWPSLQFMRLFFGNAIGTLILKNTTFVNKALFANFTALFKSEIWTIWMHLNEI